MQRFSPQRKECTLLQAAPNEAQTSCIDQVCPDSDQAALLERLWSYDAAVPEWDIKAAMNSAGQVQRIRLALDKLLKGEIIKIAVLGGSPSAGLGAEPMESYLDIFKAWIESMFPFNPPEVVEHVMAKASGAVFMRCSALQEDDADIIIIELNHDDVHSNKDAENVPGAVYAFPRLQAPAHADFLHASPQTCTTLTPCACTHPCMDWWTIIAASACATLS